MSPVATVLIVALSGLTVAAAAHRLPGGTATSQGTVAIDLNRILLWVSAFFVVIGVLGAQLGRQRTDRARLRQRRMWPATLALALILVALAALSPFIEEVDPPIVEDAAQFAVPPGDAADAPEEQAPPPIAPPSPLVIILSAVVLSGLLLHRALAGRREGADISVEEGGEPTDPAERSPAWSDPPLALSGSPRHRVLAAYARFESEADGAGTGRAAWETALAHARRVASEQGLDGDTVEELALLYYRARFSAAEVEEADAERARLLDDTLEARLRRA